MPIRLDEIDQYEAPFPSSQPTAPGTLPPSIAAVASGQPYLSSVNKGGMRFTVPPPQAEVERQLSVKDQQRRSQEDAKSRQMSSKRQSEIRQQMANLQRAMGKIDLLFNEAETKLPAIQSTGLELRAKQGARVVSNLAGERETAMGFKNTFPVEARKQLKELEKGGRFTDQDIQQMLKAVTPEDLESAEARTAKRQQLIKGFRDEYDLYASELQQLGGELPEELADPNIQALQQQFPGATIRRKK